MKRFTLAIAAVAVLQAGTLFAQNLAGTWQRLMLVSEKPGDTLRVVFKISTSVGGALTGQMYSLDHGGQVLVLPSTGAVLGFQFRGHLCKRFSVTQLLNRD